MNKRFIAMLALLMCLLFVMTACSTGAPTTQPSTQPASQPSTQPDATPAAVEGPVSAAGVFPIVKDKIELTAFIAIDSSDTYEGNTFIQMLEEKTNIHIVPQLVPSSDVDQKKTLLLASNDYPDVFWGAYFNNDQILQYGVKEKIFVPITEYIEKYGFYFKEILDMKPAIKSNLIAPDGNIYGIPRTSEGYHGQSPKLWLNQAWLKNLKLEVPKTTDEFEAVLKAFKEKDPNGNGKADEIPLSGAIQTWLAEPEYQLMNSFVYTDPDHFLYKDGGKVAFAADKNQFKTGLIYIKKLYDEKLIDPAAFTQKLDQLAQTCQQDPMIVGAFTAGHLTMGIDGNNRAAMEAFTAMSPVKGPDGIQYAIYDPMASSIKGSDYTITDKCKNPEAAFRMADYFMSEETTMIMMYGKEGVNWKKAEPNQKTVIGKAAKYIVIQPKDEQETKAKGLNRFWCPPFGDIFERREGAIATLSDDLNDMQNYEARLYAETNKLVSYWPSEDMLVPDSFFIEPALKDEFTDIKTNIVKYVKESMVQFIMGGKDIEKDWDAYLKDLEKFGLARYIEIYQGIVDGRK